MTTGIRRTPARNENCDTCGASLRKGTHVEIETFGFLVRLCRSCGVDVGRLAK